MARVGHFPPFRESLAAFALLVCNLNSDEMKWGE